MMPILNIEFEGIAVGELSLDTQVDELRLTYTENWQKNHFALSPHLPLQGTIHPVAIQRFLRNLLPEGRSFDDLVSNYQISKNNTFGLIRILGRDTASGLVFKTPEQELVIETAFRPISELELIDRLNQREFKSLAIWDSKLRLSLAGVQDKINVLLDESGELGFGEGQLCSTHILKFENHPQTHLVLNEYLMMSLARRIGLPVAIVSLQHYGHYPVLLVERFDRRRLNMAQVQRRYVIDACQALSLPPEYKYERNFGSGRDVAHIRDGASLEKLFGLVRQTIYLALESKKLLDQILFNLCIDNHDAHGKNFSFYVDKKGLHLTPAYDLVNIAVYSEFEQTMAMALGDEFDSKTVYAYQLADFADNCGLSRRLVANRLKVIAQAILGVLNQGTAKGLIINADEQAFVIRLEQIVKARCKHLLEQTQAITSINL